MRWIESTLTPFPSEDGERHVLVVSRDVPQLHELEHTLSREPRALQADRRERLRHDRRIRQRFRRQYSNDRCARCSASTEARLRSTPSFVHPDDLGAREAMFAACSAARGVEPLHLSHPPRRRIVVLDRRTLRSYRLRDGRRNFLIIARDVSARVEAEQRVRESERRYRELVENAPMGIFVVQDNRIVFANAAAAALHGAASPAALCGTNLLDWLNEADVRAVIDSMARTSRGGVDGGTFTLRFVGADGRERHLSGLGTAITFAGAPAFQCIVRDVTELEQSRRQQEDLSLQLQEARKLESLGVLAGGIAHDFNNLLAVILSSVRYARSTDADGVRPRRGAHDAEEATESAARLVKQLLAYAGRRSPEVRTIDLSELARSLSDLLSHRAAERRRARARPRARAAPGARGHRAARAGADEPGPERRRRGRRRSRRA
jgi:PAS domain S-box-containing protein